MRTFLRDLEKFVTIPTTAVSEYEIPWLMSGLICHRLSTSEAQELSELVCRHKWEAIFVNFFDLILGSAWQHDLLHGQRPNYHPNDEFDRWRAAVALAHSDLFITDSYMTDLCRRAKVADYTPTTVFSTKQIGEILQFIDQNA